MDRRKLLKTAAVVLFASTFGTPVANAQAQAWPTRSISIALAAGNLLEHAREVARQDTSVEARDVARVGRTWLTALRGHERGRLPILPGSLRHCLSSCCGARRRGVTTTT